MTTISLERNARRMRIYIGESDRWRGQTLYAALLETFKREGMAGATVMRGVAGFGAHSRIHTASILDLSTDLPLIVEVIDTAVKIQHAIEVISPMVREGLITVEDIEVIRYTHRYLQPLSLDRPVSEIMTRDPISVLASETAVDAWKVMLAKNIKALPVLDEQRRVVGVLTHDDFMDRAGVNARLAVARQLDTATLNEELDNLTRSKLSTGAIMSKPVITVSASDSVSLAAERLVRHAITRLPVVDAEGRLVGMVSRLDLLRQVIDNPETAKKTTERFSAGRLAGETMITDVPVVTQTSDLAAVIDTFLASGEHRVIVQDAQGHPVGLISDSDVVGRIQPPLRKGILGALRGNSRPPSIAITAGELMSAGVDTVARDTPLVDAVQRMLRGSRKWLVVVDEEGKMIGLIDRETALNALVGGNL